ncbi:hypothetical protein BGX26_000072 [Mortierella sp. AD094]|nr:hypothetical protein BGX26_000072 [Mortierella sp. AD094]
MLDRPFSDVCSTVSCWALLFSVIIPSMQVLGVEVSVNSPSYTSVLSRADSSQQQQQQQQQQQHLYLQQLYNLDHRQHSFSKPQIFSLAVYLESGLQELFPLSLLTNPSVPSIPQKCKKSSDHCSQHQGHSSLQCRPPNKVRARGTSKSQTARSKRLSSLRNSWKRGSKNVRTVVMDLDTAISPKESIHLSQDYKQGQKWLSRQQCPHTLIEGLYDAHSSTIAGATVKGHLEPHEQYQEKLVSITEEERDAEDMDCHTTEDGTIYATMRALAEAVGMLLEETEMEDATLRDTPSDVLSISEWTRDDLEFAKALWDYWDELDALNRIHIQLERELSDELGHSTPSGPPLPPLPPHRLRQESSPITDTRGRSEDTHPEAGWLQDDITGPIVRFPLSAPMPTMPHQWIALMPCTLEIMIDHTVLSLDTSAIIFYPTLSIDCTVVPAFNDSSIPLLTLDRKDAEKLISILDNLSYGNLAMCTFSKWITHTMDATRTMSLIEEIPRFYDEQDYDLQVDDSESDKKGYEQPKEFQVMSRPTIVSVFDSFKSEAAVRVRRVLVNLGLDGGYSTRKSDASSMTGPIDEDNPQGSKSEAMVSTSYYRFLDSALHRQNLAPTTSNDEKSREYGATTDGGRDQTLAPMETPSARSPVDTTTVAIGEEIDEARDVSTIFPFSRHHSKARTRPNRLAHRAHPSLPSQILDDDQYLIMAKEASRRSNSLSTFWSNSYIQHHYSRYSSNISNTSIAGKITMVLMSTVCTVGVGMFGALLFVVALKVRLFRSRRLSRHASHSQQTTQQLISLQQQHREIKKVIPKGVLESFGVKTVLHNSSTTVTLTAAKAKTRSEMALFTKGRLPYAKDVIEMEEGLEDPDSRVNSRRQRLGRRRRTGSGQLLLGVLHDHCDCEEDEDDDEKDSALSGDESDMDGDEYGDERDSFSQPLLDGVTDSSIDVEQIAAAILTATSQGSHRRISYNRQGQLNRSSSSPVSRALNERRDIASSSSSSVSLSRSSMSIGGRRHKSCCSSHSHKKKKKQGEQPFANANAQTMCAVCLAEYGVGDKVRTLPCFHQYHQGCIDPWLLNVSSLCPICKRDLWPGSH